MGAACKANPTSDQLGQSQSPPAQGPHVAPCPPSGAAYWTPLADLHFHLVPSSYPCQVSFPSTSLTPLALTIFVCRVSLSPVHLGQL